MFDFLKSKPAQPPKLMKTALFLTSWSYNTTEFVAGNEGLVRPAAMRIESAHMETRTNVVKHFEWAEAHRLDSTSYQVFNIFDEGQGPQESKFLGPQGAAVFTKDEAVAMLENFETNKLNDPKFTLAKTPEKTRKHFSRYVTQGAQPTRPNGGADASKGPAPV